MGCAFVKPRNPEIHPSENVNNNSTKRKKITAQDDSTETPEKQEESHLELGNTCMSRQSSAPTCSTNMAEEKDSSKESLQSTGGQVLRRSTSGHLIPQPVPNSDLGDGFMSLNEVYNSMNDGQRMPYLHDPNYMLILDVREREAFNETHITTARHSSAVDTEYDCLLSQGKLDKFTIIVVYDQTSTAKEVDPTLASFVERLKEASVDAFILSGGFQSFSQTYPFLCNNLTIRSEQDRMRLFKSYPSVVLEGALYQGNVKHSQDEQILKNLKITHVLNVSTECKNAFPDRFQYLQVKVEDETSAQLGPRLRSAGEFITKALSGGGKVFVHCVQGKSRSSTCTIAFLMSSRGWTLKDAHEYLKDRRSIAAPNRGFLIQLSKFEESVFGKVLSSVDDLYF